MPHLALTFLGGFAVTLEGRPLTAFGTDKARALLAYLAVEAARPHQRAALAQLFWPDAPAERAAHNLRQTLLRVRRALHEDDGPAGEGRQPLLLLTRQVIQLNPLGDCRLDVAVFTELLRACQTHAHAQAATCRVCMGWLAQAAELYRGDFLAGFALRDSMPFEEWQLVQQEMLHRQAVQILVRLATYHEGRGELELVQRYAGRLAALDPWHEQGQLQLMRALAHSGQIGAAAEQYAAYSAALDKEFGVLPSQEVMALHQQIQARQFGGESGSAQALGQVSRGGGAPARPRERRLVTVLSCRWRDPTGQGDPEALEERMAHVEPWLQVLLERYGGYRQPGQGDEWLIYFGYPQVYEDAARRALHVALALRDATSATHALSMGIHTGVMVVPGGDRPGATLSEPIGAVPAVARGCQALAEPGAVLLTAATEQLVRGWFVCQPLGAQLVPGLLQGSAVYQMHGEHAGQSPLAWLAQRRHLTTLAGREGELHQLTTALEAAAQGRGAILTLSGEAGAGKSRLLWELRQRAGQAVRWVEHHCAPYFQNTHLHPIIGVLEDLLGIAEGDSPETRAARLTSTLAQYGLQQPGAAWLLAILLGLPTEPPAPQPITAQQRERMREVVVALFQRAAAARALVLVIEDVHWADPSTVAWLGASLAALAAAPCLTLLTFRPTFSPPWLPGPYLHALTLAPLQATDIERMVADLTRVTTLPAPLQRRIIAQSDGLPLFVEELTRMLLEAGAQDADTVIPTTLRDLLLARLERVGPAWETAGWAAALGREFDYPVLAAVVPYDEPRLQADLAALSEAELMTNDRKGSRLRYGFKHALLQEAIHESLLRRTQEIYHQRIAECITARFPQISEAQPELVAQHYQQGGLHAQATDRWLLAGERAFAQGAGQEARTFFEKAVQLVRAGDNERHWRGLVGREQVLDLIGAREAQQATLVALRDLAEALDDDARRAYVLVRQISYAGTSGDYRGVLALTDVASAMARRAGDLSLELTALAYKAQALAGFHELEATRQVIEAALAHLENLRDNVLRARILTVAAYYYLAADDLVRAVMFQRESLAAAQEGGDHRLMLTLNANLALLYTTLGCYTEARTTLERGLDQAVLVGDPWIQAGTMRHLGLVHWSYGELGLATAHLDEALALLTHVGDAFGSATCHGYLGYVLEAAGDYVRAAEHLALACAGFAALGMEEDRCEAQAVEARVLLALARRDEARQRASEVWAWLRDHGVAGLPERSLVCLCLADVFAALGDPELPSTEVIAMGYGDLMQRAAKISDPEWRRSFLENVPTNRDLVERWQHSGAAGEMRAWRR
ncbi:MAG: AAA family ATPase [Chloroflexales bacterium]|nr:AAA family ATPase [Chloroflexales bacterium]